MHQNYDEEKHELDEETLKRLDIMRSALNRIIAVIKQPMDPKIIALLEMAVDMIEEQVMMDKVYEYPDCPTCVDTDHEKPNIPMLFFENKSPPSAQDLEQMFDTSWMDNNDD